MNKLPFPYPLSKTGLYYLSPIKVLNDGQMETLLTLPLCLHGVVEKFPEWPIRPLQQLVVQQERVGSLCKTNYSNYQHQTHKTDKVHRDVNAFLERHLSNG